MSSLAPLLMSPSSICLSRTAACQAHTSLRRQLWRSYRTMSPTFIRYGFILCQNYIATSLSHAQNPRLAYQDAALAPPSHQDQTSPSFTNLFHMLPLLPNFFPSEVRRLISDFKIEESTGLSYFYSYDAFTHLKQLGIRPGTSSTTMAHPYDWPLEWDLNPGSKRTFPRATPRHPHRYTSWPHYPLRTRYLRFWQDI